MAKTSAIQRNLKRVKLAAKYLKKRNALKKIIKNKNLPLEERFNAQLKLEHLPRNSERKHSAPMKPLTKLNYKRKMEPPALWLLLLFPYLL